MKCARCCKKTKIIGLFMSISIMCEHNKYPFLVNFPILCKKCRKSFKDWWINKGDINK